MLIIKGEKNVFEFETLNFSTSADKLGDNCLTFFGFCEATELSLEFTFVVAAAFSELDFFIEVCPSLLMMAMV